MNIPVRGDEPPRPASDGLEDRFKQLDRNGDGKPLRDGLAQIPTLERVRSVADAWYVQTAHRRVIDGRERTYIVQASKQSRGPLPVVFFFHGGGGRGANMANVGFREMVAKEQFLAVYPDGWRGNRNDGRNAPRTRSQQEGEDDVKFIRAIVEDLASRYEIDRSRIFATGASNGGLFCHYLAAKAADLFAGIAPVIGGLAEPVALPFQPIHPISLLVIQGEADPLVPIGGGPIAGSDRGGRVIATEEMLKKYLAHNGITGPPQVEQLPDRDPNDGTTTEVRLWPPGRDGVRVEYYLVKGGGHTMPGRSPGGPLREWFAGKTSRDFDALEVIWNFFKSCPPRRQTDSTPNQVSRKEIKIVILGWWLSIMGVPIRGEEPSRLAAGGLAERFKQLDRNGDGKISREEFPRPLFDRLDANQDGFITLEEAQAILSRPEGTAAAPSKLNATAGQQPQSLLERIRSQYGDIKPRPHKDEIAEQRPGEPPLKKMPDGDPARDAAGRGQLFESIVVPGFTSIQEGMNGLAIVDLNKDGWLDIVATYSPPRGTGARWGAGEKLRMFLNEGGFRFREHKITILDSKVSPDAFGRGQVPVLADFNGDGYLDLFVTRNAQMSGGQSNPNDQKLGNGLYLSDGAWDRFRDVSAKMGIQNEKAYNRQPSFGDVNKDGWLDIAIGCDNIGNAMGGFPHSRLYVFKPNGPNFLDGHFEDIGGTDLVPDFGGFYHDSTKDKAGPDINLLDLDGDGDLDLLQSYHVDIRDPSLPFSPVEYRQGVFCWKNLLVETGKLQFEKVTGNGLACAAHLKLDRATKTTTPVGKAPGLPYISLADVDNDGLLDVLAVGPADPGWAPRTEYVSGRFWRNKGNFHFEEATDAAGLSALNWVYRDWCKFFDAPMPRQRPGALRDPAERRPYFADAIFGDFDNDGWVDLIVLDRSESMNPEARAILFMNRGKGVFEPKPTTFSGLDSRGICGEAADLNNDGLLDLVFAADPDNSGIAFSMAAYESKVYWNTGAHGGNRNHWLRLRFSGVIDAELIGARVELAADGKKQYRWIHANHSYKSGGALEAHFGLGQATTADVKVTLLNGRTASLAQLRADRYLELNLTTLEVTPLLKE